MVTAPANPRLLTPYVLTEQGDWFEAEIHFIRRLLQPGMGVVDIGANYGIYTLTAARAVGPTGRVVAFEPGSLPHACLGRSLQANGLTQVELRREALSNRTGLARLGVAANSELNSLSNEGGEGEEVSLVTLDSAADAWNRPIDFLKLDAEGEEIRILEGAERFFARHDPLVMFELRHGAGVNHGLLDAFRRRGFDLYRLLPGLGVLVPLDLESETEPFLLNVFACRPARADLLRQAGLLVTAPGALPAAEAEPAMEVLARWAGNSPWAGALWRRGVPAGAGAWGESYVQALADTLRSEDPARALAQRWSYLNRALETLSLVVGNQASPGRRFALARAALACGSRKLANDCLWGLGESVDVGAWVEEPFLPPVMRLDALNPAGGTFADVFAAMRDESLVESGAFSVYFLPKKLLPVLRRLGGNPLCSAAARRRLKTARRIFPPEMV